MKVATVVIGNTRLRRFSCFYFDIKILLRFFASQPCFTVDHRFDFFGSRTVYGVFCVNVDNGLFAGVQRFDTLFHVVCVADAAAPRLMQHDLRRGSCDHLVTRKGDDACDTGGDTVNMRDRFALIA